VWWGCGKLNSLDSPSNGSLVRRLPAHFQRIIEVKSLVFGKENCVLTSSVDRSIKVWNLEYIFQEVGSSYRGYSL
jgi:WD40 repeat protein